MQYAGEPNRNKAFEFYRFCELGSKPKTNRGTIMQIGMIGLGRMGSAMVHRLLTNNHQCAVYDADPASYGELVAAGATSAATVKQLVDSLETPRVVWMMVPANKVDEVIEPLCAVMEPGDILIDGGNSHYKDDIFRSEKLSEYGVAYVDVGTSGGVWGRERGYCLMIGGESSVVDYLEPLFKSLAPDRDSIPATAGPADLAGTAEQGYLYCGGCGAGHFVKMIHNGIEYGLMAAYAEGFEMLSRARDLHDDQRDEVALPRLEADGSQIAELWRRGSVVGSWLLDLAAQSLRADPGLNAFSGHVSDSGEGRWTVETATQIGVPAYVLSAALFQRFSSRGEGTYGNKLLSALRFAFGGHEETK